MRLTSSLRLFASLVLLAAPVAAQNGGVARGADAISESLIRRHIEVIADDSMLGRDTPSRGLDLTAQYVAETFRRLGLKPGGDGGTYEQRYAINTTKFDTRRSSVTLKAGAASATASFQRDARLMVGARTGRPVSGPAVLLGGALDSATVARADVQGKMVLLVADFTGPLQSINTSLNALLLRRPRAILMITNRDTVRLAQLLRTQSPEEVKVGVDTSATPVVVEVHDRAAAPVLSAGGVDLRAIRAATGPVTHPLPALEVSLTVVDQTVRAASAPNAVGILEGTDPALRSEYVVYSAHMDHEGVQGGSRRDSIWNGADDNGSGTAGVLALAEAFAKAPTKRSIIFLTVSGEEKGLWGSEYFASHPPVPIGQIVANINLDMIGRNWRDTIAVIGKEHSDLGATLNRVNAAHPDLGMHAIDDIWPHENFYSRSDHYNFAKRGVPILFFFNGVHADYHEASDSPEKIDAEKEARIVKLIYFVGQEIGNAAARPRWNEESYKRIVR